MSEELQRLQMLDHNVQQMTAQKQQFQSQLFELENALKELESSPSAYKIIGNIMVMTDKATLKKELDGKKELLDLRIKNIEKQEKQLKDKVKQLQQDVLKNKEQ
ncbi:MAG: prefoldin subunit beta [Nanoarchaeota archaeon]